MKFIEPPVAARVTFNSWAGLSQHQVKLIGIRKNGRFVAEWDDEPAFRRRRGDLLYPPRAAVQLLEPLPPDLSS